MIEHDLDIKARSVKKGDRIAINSCYCLNPSRSEMRDKAVPVSITVLAVRDLATEIRIEDVGNILYSLPPTVWVKKILSEPEPSDSYKPQFSPKSETYKWVSIE